MIPKNSSELLSYTKKINKYSIPVIILGFIIMIFPFIIDILHDADKTDFTLSSHKTFMLAMGGFVLGLGFGAFIFLGEIEDILEKMNKSS